MSIKNTIFLLCLMPLVAFAAKPLEIQEIEIVNKPLSIPEIIHLNAVKYHVSEDILNKVIDCESDYNVNAKNLRGERSYGIVQINLNAHKSITIEQATDPEFAIDFLAKNIADKHGSMWSCYRRL